MMENWRLMLEPIVLQYSIICVCIKLQIRGDSTQYIQQLEAVCVGTKPVIPKFVSLINLLYYYRIRYTQRILFCVWLNGDIWYKIDDDQSVRYCVHTSDNKWYLHEKSLPLCEIHMSDKILECPTCALTWCRKCEINHEHDCNSHYAIFIRAATVHVYPYQDGPLWLPTPTSSIQTIRQSLRDIFPYSMQHPDMCEFLRFLGGLVYSKQDSLPTEWNCIGYPIRYDVDDELVAIPFSVDVFKPPSGTFWLGIMLTKEVEYIHLYIVRPFTDRTRTTYQRLCCRITLNLKGKIVGGIIPDGAQGLFTEVGFCCNGWIPRVSVKRLPALCFMTRTEFPDYMQNDSLISGPTTKLCTVEVGSLPWMLIPTTKYQCDACLADNARNRCSRCKVVHYCNVRCQTTHWMQHKLVCRAQQEWVVETIDGGRLLRRND